MRDSAPSARLTTESAPSPTASALGAWPTWTGATTAPVRGSSGTTGRPPRSPPTAPRRPRRSRSPSRRRGSRAPRARAAEVDAVDVASAPETTHNAPSASASERGALAASIRCSTLLEPGSTCATLRPSPSATHSEPAPNARRRGRRRRRSVTIWRSRSMRETVPTSRLATHTDPPPAVTAPGLWPTGYWAVMRPPSGSISPTGSSSMPGSPSGSSTRMTRTPAPRRARARRRRPAPRATGAAGGACAGTGSGAAAGRSSAGSWRGLLVQPPQLGTGLDPDLLDERGARRAVGGQRLGLTVPRDTARASSGRAGARATVRRHERVELSDHPAWRPAARSASIASSAARSRSSSRRRISPRERLVGQVRERLPPPQRQRLTRARLEQALERTTSRLVRRAQLVATTARHDARTMPSSTRRRRET